jgi:hypothetical protein
VRRRRGSDRHRQDHARRAALTQRARGRLRAVTGRQAIVDEQHRPTGDRQPPASGVAASRPLGQLAPRAPHHRFELGGIQPQPPHGLVIDDEDIVLGERPDPVLGVAGRPDLAHEHKVERRLERARHLGRHRHPAARDAHHDRILVAEIGEQRRQTAPRVAAVGEAHVAVPRTERQLDDRVDRTGTPRMSCLCHGIVLCATDRSSPQLALSASAAGADCHCGLLLVELAVIPFARTRGWRVR